MNTVSPLQWPLLFGVYDPNGEVTQMHKFKILGKTRQMLFYKSKQVPWEHRKEDSERTLGELKWVLKDDLYVPC